MAYCREHGIMMVADLGSSYILGRILAQPKSLYNERCGDSNNTEPAIYLATNDDYPSPMVYLHQIGSTNEALLFYLKSEGTGRLIDLYQNLDGTGVKAPICIGSRTGLPSTAQAGDLIVHNNKLKYHDGTNWKEVATA